MYIAQGYPNHPTAAPALLCVDKAFFSPLFSFVVLCNDSLKALSLLLLKLILTFNSLISFLKALFSLSIDEMEQLKE